MVPPGEILGQGTAGTQFRERHGGGKVPREVNAIVSGTGGGAGGWLQTGALKLAIVPSHLGACECISERKDAQTCVLQRFCNGSMVYWAQEGPAQCQCGQPLQGEGSGRADCR